MSRMLQGGCQAPIGGYAVVRNGRLHLRGFVSDLEGVRFYRAESEAAQDEADALGKAVATALIGQGADRLLAEIIHR